MGGIAVILNPHAGGNVDASARAGKLRRIVGDQGEVFETRDLGELSTSIERALDARPEILALCGGDGSYFRAFTAIEQQVGDGPWPEILPLPAGTINNLAHAVQSMASSPERLLSRVVFDHARGIAHAKAEVDLFRVGPSDVGYIFGAGMIVNFLRAYYATEQPSPASAARLIARLIGSAAVRGPLQAKIFQPFEADVVCDGERVPHRSYRMLIASSVRAIGLGFEPFYLAGRHPGHFHVLGGPARAMRLIRRLPRFRKGFPANDPQLYDNLAGEMQVEFARPSWYTVNGDLLGPVRRIELRRLRRITVVRG
ncbi:hypothetical protein KGQ64_10695 [bacterium]|nr:hypothetical protein [bacterium]